MTDLYALRREFMAKFDIAAPQTPHFDPGTLAMWDSMLSEEWAELQQALADYRKQPADEAERVRAMAELAAEAVDVLNVVTGLLMSQGLPLESMTEAIHQANMRKIVNGKVVRRADGKVLKPEGWQAADKIGVIRASLKLAPLK
jgi:predicted HAD superfamily Cof-like phosphohydrolase